MKLVKHLLLISIIILISGLTFAYVPKFWMIMSRTAENHGKGIYVLDQDVTFFHEQEPIILHEQWLIENGEKLRVRVSGKKNFKDKIQLTYIYNGSRKYFVNKNGTNRVGRVSADWFEPYFHFRYSKKIKNNMLVHKMVPSMALRDRQPLYNLKRLSFSPETYVRLTRVGGYISYGIGAPTPVSKSETTPTKNPGLWIEQDKFNIRKLRLPSQVEVKADKYSRYPRTLWFPATREVFWGENRILMTVNRLKPLPATNKIKAKFNRKSLDFGKDPTISAILPEDPVIKDFYTRFR